MPAPRDHSESIAEALEHMHPELAPLREAGDDPDQASERDGGTVEDYGTVTPYDDTDGDAPE